MVPRATAICAAVKHHIEAETPISKWRDLYIAVADTLQKYHNITIGHNALQKLYESNWQQWGGLDAKKHIQKAIRRDKRVKKAAQRDGVYLDPSQAVAKMHEPMGKAMAPQSDGFTREMGASLEAARNDQAGSFMHT